MAEFDRPLEASVDKISEPVHPIDIQHSDGTGMIDLEILLEELLIEVEILRWVGPTVDH